MLSPAQVLQIVAVLGAVLRMRKIQLQRLFTWKCCKLNLAKF
jgi:hypothetical protein